MDSSGITSDPANSDWTEEHEGIVVDWADKALCYRWLHEKSHTIYSKRNTWFTIPVIIMSTLTGTANFAQDRIPADYVNAATMLIGGVNIIAGIITTIQQFLKISELNEAHRVSAISWGKFYRNIKVELAKSPLERTPAAELLKHAKEEFDRLIETSPSLADNVLRLFHKTFSGGDIIFDASGNSPLMTTKQSKFVSLHKPEICDSLESTSLFVFKHKPLLDNSKLALAAKQEMEHRIKRGVIEDFIAHFEDLKKRPPTVEEIVSNLEHQIPLDIILAICNAGSPSSSTDAAAPSLSLTRETTLYRDEVV
jgi:hypothetical protein